MKYIEWQRLRSRLNHDWLKNWLMPALSKLQRVAKGQIADQEFLSEFSRKLGREWPEMAEEFDTLAEAFPNAMSTASYFDDEPLSSLPDEDKDWMRKVTHQLWLKSFPATRLVGDVRAALSDACFACKAVIQALELIVTHCETPDSSELAEKVQAFQLSCKALGDVVSQLPSKPEFSRHHD